MTARNSPEWYNLTPLQRYRRTQKGRATQDRYRRSRKGKAAKRRHYRKKRLEQTANLPVSVVRPYLQALLARHAAGADCRSLGYTSLAREIGVDDSLVRQVINYDSKKSVSQEVADRVAIAVGVPLGQFIDEAREWAKRESDPWPWGYRVNRLPRNTS